MKKDKKYFQKFIQMMSQEGMKIWPDKGVWRVVNVLDDTGTQ